MDKIELLKSRRAELLGVSREIREKISSLTDSESFVELDAYSFSRNEFYGEDANGEGVVTGYATIDSTPVYVVAQNVKVLSGGVSRANCAKIVKCLEKAAKTGYPVIYLFDSLGVSVGEGVNVLEGMAEVINASVALKGNVPQFSVVSGKLYGSFAILAAGADYNFMLKESRAAYASPLVISAKSGKKLSDEEVAGSSATKYNSITTFAAEDIAQVKTGITDILSVLPDYSPLIVDTDDDFNRDAAKLDEALCSDCLIKATFDNGKFIEMNAGYRPEVRTGIGRIGGMSVAAIVFAGEEKGVELDNENVAKIDEFVSYVNENGLPVVTFVNTLGLKTDLQTSNSLILKNVYSLARKLSEAERLSVVYGKAIGLGYTLFAAKSGGVDYSYAFATAKIGLFDGAACSAAFGEVREDKIAELEERYSDENADPVNAAKNGYIDNIIEPRFVRQYVISALQTIVR